MKVCHAGIHTPEPIGKFRRWIRQGAKDAPPAEARSIVMGEEFNFAVTLPLLATRQFYYFHAVPILVKHRCIVWGC